MSKPNSTPDLLGEGLLQAIRQAVREEIHAANGQNVHQHSKPMDPALQYLTVKEAAKISRLGVSTIRLSIRRRQLKALQVGSRVIIKRTDLEQFLGSHPIEIAPD